MKPQFALSLSFEGIRLLHRAAGGWLDVGGVALSSNDLSAELALLRKTAASLEPGGVRTKLIVPNDQIKYLTINTKGLSRKQRVEAARAALVGATPYKVRDLSFDICPDGPKTHVAAVANDTLAEAESFAAEHRFNPISFVAIPGDEAFMGEPFFGPTQNAVSTLPKGTKVEPDGIAVVIIGAVATSKIGKFADAKPEPISDIPAKGKVAKEPSSVVAEPKAVLPEAPEPDPADTETPQIQAKLPKEKPLAELDDAQSGPEPSADDEIAASSTQKTPLNLAVKPNDDKAPIAEVSGKKASEVAIAGDTAPEDIVPRDAASEPEPNSDNKVTRTPKAAIAASVVAVPISDQESVELEAVDVAAKIETPKSDPLPKFAIPPAPVGFASRRSEPEFIRPRTEPEIRSGSSVNEALIQPDSSSLDQPEPPAEVEFAPPAAELQAGPVAVRGLPPAPVGPTKGNFLSRRKALSAPVRRAEAAVAPAADATIPAPEDEADRMTVFGARKPAEIGGKPRFLGLILTAVLLVFLAGVAAWATVFLDDGLAGLFNGREKRAIASAPEYQVEPQIIRTTPEPAEGVRTAALDPDLTEEDTAVLDALSEPELAPPIPEMTEAEAEARYAVSGIWPLPPVVPDPPGTIAIDDFYLTSIDPVSTSSDAVALPSIRSFATDTELPAIASPVAVGINFALDAQGLVIPTETGAVSPDGVTVFLGRPPVMPPLTPTRSETELPVDTRTAALAELRPRDRPNNLSEANERAQLDGLTRSELADLRPLLRPRSVQEAAQEADVQREAIAVAAAAAASSLQTTSDTDANRLTESPFRSATQFAVVESVRPDVRPGNFNRIVKRAQREVPKVTQTAARTVAPSTVQPQIPTATSVAKAATINNALNLRKVNLIGVYGKPSSRRALIRLGNGRYQKVVVGDRIDGGRVSAIGDSELRYTKRGRAVVLKMPNS